MTNIKVFDKNWFKKYSKQITWLARLPFVGELIFNFKKFGHYIDRNKIVEVTPNSVIEFVSWKKGYKEVELRQHFFVRNEYALRLQKVFYPVWITFHIWDIITRPIPQLNLGFDTLTVYPDSGSGETTVDGIIGHGENLSWSNLISASGTFANTSLTSASLVFIYASKTTNIFGQLNRGIFTFDTSPIGATSTIDSATISFYGSNKLDDISIAPNINIYLASPTNDNNLVAGDFTEIGSTAQSDSAISYDDWSVTGYNDFSLNSSGKGNINKSGISRIGARNANYDVSETEPTWTSNKTSFFQCYFSDNDSNKPKLVVTYTAVVGPANVKTYKGLAAASVKTCKGLAVASINTKKGLN